MQKLMIILVAMFLIFTGNITVTAANFTSVMSGAWNNPTTWGGAGFPNLNDNVTITGGNKCQRNGGRVL